MARPVKGVVVAEQTPWSMRPENPVKALTKDRDRRKSGKTFVFTERERHAVGELVALGFSQEQVARVLGISLAALKSHFDEELFVGKMEKIAGVVDNLYNIATSWTHKGSVAAAMYILKQQGGDQWRDVQRTELSGPDGRPLQLENRTIDPSRLSDEDREALRDMMMKALTKRPQVIEGEIIENDVDGTEDLV